MKGSRFPVTQNHQDTACPVCLPDTEGQSIALVAETWRSFCSFVSKRRVFVRQFPLLANGEAAGDSSTFLEDSSADFRWDNEGGRSAETDYRQRILEVQALVKQSVERNGSNCQEQFQLQSLALTGGKSWRMLVFVTVSCLRTVSYCQPLPSMRLS